MRSMRRCLRPQGQSPGMIRVRSQDGHPVAAQGREHQFAHFAVRNQLSGVRINDFQQISIFPEMQAVLVLALEGHSGAVHFGQAVGVVYLHVEQGFDAAARLFGVGLRTHTGDAQGKGFGVFAFLRVVPRCKA